MFTYLTYVDLKMLDYYKGFMIWLVDDDAEDLDIFQNALQRNGYPGEIRLLNNGSLLMEMLSRSPRQLLPSVIVLDLDMHLKTGFDLLVDLKKDPLFRGIPVIILSGSANPDDESTCHRLGCDRYWKKPSSLHDYDVMAKYLITLF